MYKKIIFTTLLGSALLANTVHAGRGSGSPNGPLIDSTQVDTKQSVLIIQGDHFGTTTPSVFMGKWQLKIKENTDQEIIAELPKDLSSSSYRLRVVTGAPANASSAPFFTTIFVADRE